MKILNNRAFGLAECIVAALILGFAVAGFFSAFMSSKRVAVEIDEQAVAMDIAKDVMEGIEWSAYSDPANFFITDSGRSASDEISELDNGNYLWMISDYTPNDGERKRVTVSVTWSALNGNDKEESLVTVLTNI